MFEFVRTHNRLLQVALGVVIFPLFIFSGVQGYSKFRGPDAEEVATVDGHAITKGEWDQAHKQAADRMRRQNPQMDAKLLDSAEARRESLDNLVKDRVVRAAVAHQDLVISQERLMQFYATNPQLQQLLAMDPKTREAILRAQGLTPAGLDQQVRDDLAAQQVVVPVTQSAFVPSLAASHALDTILERREVQWQRFEPKDYYDKVTPTEAELKAYYDDAKNAAQFRAPEQAQIEYVVLDLAALKQQVTVNEDELKSYYDANKDKLFGSPDERRASHILVKVDASASEADKAKAKAKADAILAQVRKDPGKFAEIAKKESDDPGSAANGGDLDWFGKGAMTPAFEQAVWSMKEGQVSDVVKTDFGYHVIQLTGIRGGGAKPYAEVRPQIEDTRRRELAQTKYAEAAEQFSNMVYEQSDTLQPVADKLKLPKQTATVLRNPVPGTSGPLASQRLLDAVFAADSVRTKRNTEAIEAAPNQLVSARILTFLPAHQIPFADLKNKVTELVKQSQAAALAKKDGEAKVAELKKDPAAALAKSAVVSRVQRGDLGPMTLDKALKTDARKGPVAVGVTEPDGSYVALRVAKVMPRDPAEAATPQVVDAINKDQADAETAAFFESLKARYKAKVDEAAVSKVLASAAADKAPAASAGR